MQIQKLHSGVIMPSKSTAKSAAFDIYMPEAGTADGTTRFFPLGFASAIPEGHVALLLPRSGTGAKHGLELNNTCGVIDADYRGEWKAAMRTKDGRKFSWEAGERVLQFLVVPIACVDLVEVEQLDDTTRGTGGFGSTGR